MIADIELFGKVLLAGVLGYLVGLERELMGSQAGDRTFSLVALGAALFTCLSLTVFGTEAGDVPGRVAANVVTGVGFLGAGMILKEGGVVRGLTTAAGIWAVAAVGMAVATDRYLLAILTSLLIMAVFGAERLISVKNRRDAMAGSGEDGDPEPRVDSESHAEAEADPNTSGRLVVQQRDLCT